MSRHSPVELSSSPGHSDSPSHIRRPAPNANTVRPNNVGRGAPGVTRARRASAQFTRTTPRSKPVPQQVYKIPPSPPGPQGHGPTATDSSPSLPHAASSNHALVHPPGNYDFIAKRIPLELIPLPKAPSPPPPPATARDATLVELYAYNAARGGVLTQSLRREEWEEFTHWVEKHPQGPEPDVHRRRKARLLQESQELDATRHELWLNSEDINDEAEMLCAKLERLEKNSRSRTVSSEEIEMLQQEMDEVQADLDEANDRWEANDRKKRKVEAKSWALTDVRWDRLPQWCRSER